MQEISDTYSSTVYRYHDLVETLGIDGSTVAGACRLPILTQEASQPDTSIHWEHYMVIQKTDYGGGVYIDFISQTSQYQSLLARHSGNHPDDAVVLKMNRRSCRIGVDNDCFVAPAQHDPSIHHFLQMSSLLGEQCDTRGVLTMGIFSADGPMNVEIQIQNRQMPNTHWSECPMITGFNILQTHEI